MADAELDKIKVFTVIFSKLVKANVEMPVPCQYAADQGPFSLLGRRGRSTVVQQGPMRQS